MKVLWERYHSKNRCAEANSSARVKQATNFAIKYRKLYCKYSTEIITSNYSLKFAFKIEKFELGCFEREKYRIEIINELGN